MYEAPSIIKEVGDILRLPLPRAREDIEAHVVELEKLRVPLAEAVVDAGRLVAEKRLQALWPKDAEKKLTELERTVRLEGDIAVYERDYQFLLRLEKFIEQRLTVIITIL